MSDTPESRIRALPCWHGPIALEPLKGGLSNVSFRVVEEGGRKAVARVGEDFPFHHVSRAREAAASRAAHAAGLSPRVIHDEPGLMVLDFIDGRTFGEADVRHNVAACADLLQRCHRDLARHVRGPAQIFWVFHVLRDYAATLDKAGHRNRPQLAGWMKAADRLEAAQAPLPIVFGHHDLLPSNFLDDGARLWLIDWEYGGFGTAMFDLANIAANASFGPAEEDALLGTYFGGAPDAAIRRSFEAMKAASALREAMWAMVSELFLDSPGVDYVAHGNEFIGRFDRLVTAFERRAR
ncbi:MAG: phosphotransferase [Aestuariivirgaceae bacterium]